MQGQPLEFDASLSRAANPADLLTSVEWEWGDQTPPLVGAPEDVAVSSHVYEADGRFEVTLTVRDEDSPSSQRIQVNIRDVFPEIISVEKPEGVYALQDVTFTINAQPGAPGDPITSYDLDFTESGEYSEFPTAEVSYQYLEAGDYEVRLRVRDPDSSTEMTFPFPRMVTYLGSKPCSTSTPSSFLGRSRT